MSLTSLNKDWEIQLCMTYREEVLDNNVADKSAPKKEAKQQVLTTETD